MNTSEIIDELKKAITSEEIAEVEAKECQRFIDDIEIIVNDYLEDGSTTEDEIIEKIIQAAEYIRLLNLIDNEKLEQLIELPLVIGTPPEEVEPEVDLDSEEEEDETEDETTDDEDDDDFDKSSLDY